MTDQKPAPLTKDEVAIARKAMVELIRKLRAEGQKTIAAKQAA